MSQLIHNRKVMEIARRELRSNQTNAEVILWERLRKNQLEGRKFRRQHSVGVYILDFYCPEECLAIEVDGSVHDSPEQKEHDTTRDATLAQLHIRTVRVKNNDVEQNIEQVLQTIRSSFCIEKEEARW